MCTCTDTQTELNTHCEVECSSSNALEKQHKKNERAALHAGHAPADGSRLCTEPSCRAAYSICMGLRRTSSSNIEKTLGGWAPTECLLRVTTSVEKRKTLCCSFFFVCLFLIFFLSFLYCHLAPDRQFRCFLAI